MVERTDSMHVPLHTAHPHPLTHINKYMVKNSSVWWPRPKSPHGGVGRRQQQPISVWPGHTEAASRLPKAETQMWMNAAHSILELLLNEFPVCFRSEIWRTGWREPFIANSQAYTEYVLELHPNCYILQLSKNLDYRTFVKDLMSAISSAGYIVKKLQSERRTP